jgi:outer membrane lipoprotein-sorting protein
MSEPNAVPKVAEPKNVPLTSEQKLTLMSIQRKILAKQLQAAQIQVEINKLGQQQQMELSKVTIENNINPTVFTLSDELELVPLTPTK